MYFITCLEKVEKDKLGWLDTGSQRTFGYYTDKEVAIQAVKENRCDLHECLYLYAVVEDIPQGIHAICKERLTFKFNLETKEFEQIDEPEEFKNYTNFAIG